MQALSGRGGVRLCVAGGSSARRAIGITSSENNAAGASRRSSTDAGLGVPIRGGWRDRCPHVRAGGGLRLLQAFVVLGCVEVEVHA